MRLRAGGSRPALAAPRLRRPPPADRVFRLPGEILYLDLDGLEARTLVQRSGRMEVFLYLSRAAPELERAVGADNFALGCTPAINLFPVACEPIALDGTQSDWLVVPDSRRPAALEVYALTRVRKSRPEDPRPRLVAPLHRLRPDGGAEGEVEGMSWLAARRPAPPSLGGTETRLMLRDPAFDPALPADGVLSVDALCCNRDLPSLPFAGGVPRLRIADPTCQAAAAECLGKPTDTLRPTLGDRSAWRLVSHLALNHLGVTAGGSGAVAEGDDAPAPAGAVGRKRGSWRSMGWSRWMPGPASPACPACAPAASRAGWRSR